MTEKTYKYHSKSFAETDINEKTTPRRKRKKLKIANNKKNRRRLNAELKAEVYPNEKLQNNRR